MIEGNTYQERVESQVRQWADGVSLHNTVEDECCPDFSCCNKLVNTDPELKKTFLHANEEQRESLLFVFLGNALKASYPEKDFFIVNGKDEITNLQNNVK